MEVNNNEDSEEIEIVEVPKKGDTEGMIDDKS